MDCRPNAVSMDPNGLTVRDSMPRDVAAIQRIYARHVLKGLASFEEEPPSAAAMAARRDRVVALGLPHLVAVIDGTVVGFCYAAPYRDRSAYRYTLEDSVYLDDGFIGRGIGRALLSTLLDRCDAGPWRQMIAVIGDSGNAASIGLHRSLGFDTVGIHRSVGFKFGRWVDSVLMQRAVGPGGTALPDGGC